jgi:hypothetical protein
MTNERSIFDTVADVEAENEAGGFADSDILMELREYVRTSLEANDCISTGMDGCGCGSADIEMEFEGIRFNVSISLSEDEETEH